MRRQDVLEQPMRVAIPAMRVLRIRDATRSVSGAVPREGAATFDEAWARCVAAALIRIFDDPRAQGRAASLERD